MLGYSPPAGYRLVRTIGNHQALWEREQGGAAINIGKLDDLPNVLKNDADAKAFLKTLTSQVAAGIVRSGHTQEKIVFANAVSVGPSYYFFNVAGTYESANHEKMRFLERFYVAEKTVYEAAYRERTDSKSTYRAIIDSLDKSWPNQPGASIALGSSTK